MDDMTGPLYISTLGRAVLAGLREERRADDAARLSALIAAHEGSGPGAAVSAAPPTE